MRRPIGRAVLILALAAMTASACDDNDTTTPTTPTIPTTPTVTEEFTGDLTVNGAMTWVFVTSTGGTLTSTLTTLDPGDSPSVTLSIGTWNGTACQIVIANDAATTGAVVTGTVSSATSLCTRIADAGRLNGPVSYKITVVHP
jgi:hypothetical protein